MSGNCTEEFIDKIAQLIKPNPTPEVFVETGTYWGGTIAKLLHRFRVLHTIELDKKLYKQASERFENEKKVVCHCGDSAEVLEKILPEINEAIVLFLDAHYAGGNTAYGEDETPLLRELTVISKRKYSDIIIIDDVRMLGKTGVSEPNSSYPWEMKYDWREVTEEKLKKTLGGIKTYVWQRFGDRIVVLINQEYIDRKKS